jgi:hypothetical protein
MDLMEATMKNCPHCGHSRAAHLDGTRCALCGCRPGRDTFIQDSFSFREALPTRVTNITRKR